MASFQPADGVRLDQTTFFNGNIAKQGPCRSNALVVNTQAPLDSDFNIVGNAFTFVAGVDGQAQAGGDSPLVFAGILVGPNQYAMRGDVNDALLPSLIVPNGIVGDFVYMGIISVVLHTNPNNLTGAAAVGDYIVYDASNGDLSSNGTSNVAPAGYVLIPNAQVTRFNTTAEGYAEITLLGGQPA